MCLVIDTCTFDSVFDPTAKGHSRFKPVISWLVDGQGKIIFGGKKFKRELKGAAFLRILLELERRGKLVRVADTSVDRVAKQLKTLAPEKDFDDEHIVALVIVTKCCVVCTDDRRAIPYLKRREFYPKGVRPPKIYRHRSHSSLCRNQNIVAACR